MVSSLVAASEILPNNGYLKLAENFFSKIEKKYLDFQIYHSYSKEIVFLEDYAFLIHAQIDLSDKTMNFKYKDLARKCTLETIQNSTQNQDIFQKIQKRTTMFFDRLI